ncbi:MAG: phage tail protein [Lentisphaeraceae bacterium]|nr:phage tail protein [Lentisphaeraceae bacterium]
MANYPLPVFHFQVEWGGTNIGFQEVSGLSIETQVIEYRDGSMPQYSTIKMSGLQQYSNITLKRGVMAADNEFFAWINATALNKPERRDLTISLLNEEHSPVMVWKVTQAWPTKVEGPSLNSTGNEVAVETIEIAHEGVTIENS